MNTLRGWLCAGLGAVAMVSPGASGQGRLFDPTANRPTGYGLPVGDWQFVAVVERGASGQAHVPGVLALYDKDLAVGNNIVAVWYERPATPGQSWSTKAWEDTDQWSAIKWTKQRYAIADDFDAFWPTKDALSAGAAAQPVDYNKGVLVADPLSTIMDSSNRDTIVALLAQMGYKAADISLEKTTSCEPKYVLDGYAATVEFAVTTFAPGAPGWGASSWNGQDPGDVVDTFLSLQVPQSCLTLGQGAPPPPPPPIPVVPGTTTPQPGTPLNPGAPWQRDSFPGVRDPSCDGVSSCCYKARIIWLYTTTDWLGQTVIRYCESNISWTCPANPDGTCPAAPSCSEPPGPHTPPGPPGPADCDHNYY